MVFNKYRSILQILENYTKFFKIESCGSCTPCRAGNQILYDKIQKIKKGICTSQDLTEIKDWGKIMRLTSKCGLGQYSANSFAMAIDKFEDYFKLKTIELNENQNVEFDMEEAVFEYESLISGIVEKSAAKFSIQEIEGAVTEKLKKGSLIKPYNKNDNSLTTPKNLIAEKKCIQIMQKLQNIEKLTLYTQQIL